MVNGIIIMKKEVQIYSYNLLQFLNSNGKKTKHIYSYLVCYTFFMLLETHMTQTFERLKMKMQREKDEGI